MTKHTPGPWRIRIVENCRAEVLVETDEADIAELIDFFATDAPEDDPERMQVMANACLIATAPELLDAVKGLRILCRMHVIPDGAAGEILSKIDEVISKAEGSDA